MPTASAGHITVTERAVRPVAVPVDPDRVRGAGLRPNRNRDGSRVLDAGGPGPDWRSPAPASGTLSAPLRGADASSSSSALTCCRSAACAVASDRPCV